MSEKTTTNGSNAATSPQTPPYRDSPTNWESAGLKSTGRSTTSAPPPSDHILDASTSPSAPAPFLAYARRIRSFFSPFQVDKSRYLLTFYDEPTAQKWWALMQSEYPDSVRESPQLFSFKSDRVPSRAWENPRFEHLREKWTYRQLDESESMAMQKEKDGTRARKASLLRTLSMPAVREGSSSPELVRDGSEGLDDPFTPQNDTERERTGLAQLSITSDRIHRSVSQTKSNMDALLEGQNANSKSMQKVQTAMDQIMHRVDVLDKRQQGHEEVMARMQSTIEQSAGDSGADPLESLHAEVSKNSAHLKTLLDSHKTAKKSIQKMQSTLDQQAASQRALAEQMEAIYAANVAIQASIQRVNENQDARFEKLLLAFDRHTTRTHEIMAFQQDTLQATRNDIMGAIQDGASACSHDVLPPPRKVNRKLVGYVYSREGR
ncbi:hypothetical protein BDV97DRAFT_400594 [Delphinella strobiligena]|nr:hypothetical protein BDV97DRAFT_400594 [Delphinella strobiligena]